MFGFVTLALISSHHCHGVRSVFACSVCGGWWKGGEEWVDNGTMGKQQVWCMKCSELGILTAYVDHV